MKFFANSRHSPCQTSVNDSTSVCSFPNHSRYRISSFSLPNLTVLVTESRRSRYRISPFSLPNSLPVVIRNDLSFEESIVAELKFGRKKYFLLFCIEVLPLIITRLLFKPSYQILIIYMQKSKRKFLLRHFLQEILMLIPSIGGLMVIQLLKVLKSNFFCLH